jgi:hypothetical protein
MAPIEAKVKDSPKKIARTSLSYSIDATEILKVMTETFLFAILSPLRSYLTSLLQSKEKGVEKVWKRRRRLLRRLEEMRVVRRNDA